MLQEIDEMLLGIKDSDHQPLTLDFALGELVYLSSKYRKNRCNILKSQIEAKLASVLDAFADFNFISGYIEGFEGFFNCIGYLKRCGIHIDTNILDDLYPYLIVSIENDILRGNYDFSYGYIGKMLYLLDTDSEFTKEETKVLIDKILTSLEKRGELIEDGVFWYNLYGRSVKSVNLGLAHGMSSILIFLARIYSLEYRKLKVESMIYMIINFFIYCKNKESEIASFPNEIFVEDCKIYRQESNSRLAWCLGDIAVIYSIIYASEVLETNKWNSLIDEVLMKIARRGISESGITHFHNNSFFDIAFCHGISGIVYLLHMIQKKYKTTEVFDKRLRYWKDQLELNINLIDLSVEKIYYPFDMQGEDMEYTLDKGSFFNGVTGAAMVLMSIENDDDEWANLIGIY